jgi:hypothetical protein
MKVHCSGRGGLADRIVADAHWLAAGLAPCTHSIFQPVNIIHMVAEVLRLHEQPCDLPLFRHNALISFLVIDLEIAT